MAIPENDCPFSFPYRPTGTLSNFLQMPVAQPQVDLELGPRATWSFSYMAEAAHLLAKKDKRKLIDRDVLMEAPDSNTFAGAPLPFISRAYQG